METFTTALVTAVQQAILSMLHNWPYLLAAIVIAALLKLYVDAAKVSAFLKRNRNLGVVAATAAAVATPFCSCGTMAVILGMMASTMSWAPIVAFMVASPLTSPEELFLSAGLFGWPFALAFFAASILLGLAGGAIAALLESRGWLANQARFASPVAATTGRHFDRHPDQQSDRQFLSGLQPSSQTAAVASVPEFHLERLQPVNACCGPATLESAAVITPNPAVRSLPTLNTSRVRRELAAILRELYAGAKKLLPMFLGFAFVGYLLNGLIPAAWVTAIFGSGHAYSVPLAATLGLPLYINTEGSLPLIRAFLDNGMSQGAALAFLIAGSGTSIGAMAGALTIARWRVVGLVIGILWLGAILAGYAYDLLLALHLF